MGLFTQKIRDKEGLKQQPGAFTKKTGFLKYKYNQEVPFRDHLNVT